MANFTTDSRKKRTYDAIVIGSGASGGWAAKELCDKGLKTLILERGRDVKHIKDYLTAAKAPWQFEYRGAVPLEKRKDFQFARFMREETMHWAIKDDEQPFIQENLLDGFVVITLAENHCCGPARPSVGAILISEVPQETALQLIGPSGIKISNPGIAT